MTTTTVYAEIVKAERNEAGDLVVVGKATGPDLDLDKQICDPGWLGKAMPEWFSTGANIREMHSAIAAGVGTELAQSGDSWMVTSTVVDASSAKKVEAGVLKGYSIGISNPKVIKDQAAPGGRIVGGSIVEVSLVDRPCNPTAMLMLSKAAKPGMQVLAKDFDPSHNLVKVEEYADIAYEGNKTFTQKGSQYEGEQPANDEPVEDAPVTKVAADDHDDDTAEPVDHAAAAQPFIDTYKAAHPDTVKGTPAEDIAGAQAAIAAIAGLIVSEAGDLATGDLGEACDIQDLLCAIDALRWFICGEAGEAANDAEDGEGIDNEDVDVLITIPLSAEPDTTKISAPVAPTAPDAEHLTELVKAAVTEAVKPYEDELKAVKGELAKVLATPRPGGPAITRNAGDENRARDIAKTTEVTRLLKLAGSVTDREQAAHYRNLAARLTAPAEKE